MIGSQDDLQPLKRRYNCPACRAGQATRNEGVDDHLMFGHGLLDAGQEAAVRLGWAR